MLIEPILVQDEFGGSASAVGDERDLGVDDFQKVAAIAFRDISSPGARLANTRTLMVTIREITADQLQAACASHHRSVALRNAGRAPFVVIVTFNGARFIQATLRAVFEQTCPVSGAFVVDNGSTDATLAIVRDEFPRVSITSLRSNNGFGRANNVGIQSALDDGAEYIALVNQDTVLHHGALEGLVTEAEGNPRYGLLGAFQFRYDGHSVDSASAVPAQLAADLGNGQLLSVYPTSFVPAVAVLIRRRALFEVGGFDPLFFMYHEDQDLCRRLWSQGWLVGVVPRAMTRHWNGRAHARRSFEWECNWAYSDAVLHLKSSRRPLPLAYMSLIKIWLMSRPRSVTRLAARIVALSRSLTVGSTVRRHRTGTPFAFRGNAEL